jgi:hypothetical protein
MGATSSKLIYGDFSWKVVKDGKERLEVIRGPGWLPFLQDVYYAREKWIATDILRIANIVSHIR